MKYAVLTMDVEDWYHSDYFLDKKMDNSYSMLDGLDRYISLLNNYNIKSTLFVLSCLVDKHKNRIRDISSMGHEIASHGDDHTRPLNIDINSFKSRIINSKNKIEDSIGVSVSGFRAPSFSLDRERLNIVKEIGFLYDSSKNPFNEHPLYGYIDMKGYKKLYSNIYIKENFVEFEANSVSLLKKNIPVSGGAYIRILPWIITEEMLKNCIRYTEFYIFYIHPFEVSSAIAPRFNKKISFNTKMRFSIGRSTVENKINKLIRLLKEGGYKFITFSEARSVIISEKI
jgi:polysaccharide deacetylase family protein (PEP-CTERM system associated)